VAKIQFTYSGNVYDAAPAGTVDFPLTTPAGKAIPYLEKAHIHVYSSGDNGTTWTELLRPGDWDFDSTGTIVRLRIAVTPDWVMVRRMTPYDLKYTTFQDSALLTAEQLNEGEDFSMYVDQELFDLGDQGFMSKPGTVVTVADQKRPNATGTASAGWPLDDSKIATAGAIAERHDAFVQDTLPPNPPLGEFRQPGKLWIDDGSLQFHYWDARAGAWVRLADTGPVGPAGTVTVGTTTTGAAGAPASVTNSGTGTAAVLDFVIPQGPQGPPGSTGPQGPPGSGLTHAATPPITVSNTAGTVTYGFDITTLATLA